MMRRRLRNSSVQRQRGFWLRCFLTGAAWLCLAGGTQLSAQLDIPRPERLTRVEGVVVNPVGKPVERLEVTVERDELVADRTQTDSAGAFHFEHLSGPYVLRVARSEYAPAQREIVVTDEIVTHLERKRLYVILGPGACKDECSSVLTSKREFDKVILRNTRTHR